MHIHLYVENALYTKLGKRVVWHHILQIMNEHASVEVDHIPSADELYLLNLVYNVLFFTRLKK